MADAKVQIGDSADFLEGTSVDTPAGTNLFREGVVISDGTDPAARAKITNTSPASDAYGLAVRIVGGVVVGSEVEVKNDSGNPIPVSGSVSVSNFPATQQVSGTVALDSASLNALESITVQNGAGANAVNIQDGGNSITVDGTVSVSNFPTTQAVSATDLDIRNLSSAQDSVTVAGSVSVSNFPTDNALTDAQLRASPVPVSGTVSVAPSQADTNVTGAWAYAAGTAGTVTLPAGSKVLQISATSLAGGSFTVNGGAAITIPANQQFTLEPRGNLVAPTLVFTSTTAYVVEYVS